MRRCNWTLACTTGALAVILSACANGARAEAGLPAQAVEESPPAAATRGGHDDTALSGDTALRAAPTVLGAPQSTGCVFQKAERPLSVAFCETFDAPASVVTRSGTMDQVLWGVSRLNTHVNPSQGQLNDYHPTRLVGCGTGEPVFAPNDVQICNGRLYESANDMGGQTTVAIYPKQPFDYTGRTGTVVFDVSLNSQGPHAAWPEFWITDKPIPAPTPTAVPEFSAWARHQFGVSFGADCKRGYTGVDRISTVRNYRVEHIPFTNELPWSNDHGQCFKTASATGELNHVEIRMSPSHAEVCGASSRGPPSCRSWHRRRSTCRSRRG
ncbi:MAG: hypothetical protein U5K74_02870 [Gemmatimonadaceae bacterium]|nr:hypothetical protein [Gemmatimonadaceae bacterium]